MKSLRLWVFFFSVTFMLTVSQVSMAQPPVPKLIYPPNIETIGNTVPFLAGEGENSLASPTRILKSPKLMDKAYNDEKITK